MRSFLPLSTLHFTRLLPSPPTSSALPCAEGLCFHPARLTPVQVFSLSSQARHLPRQHLNCCHILCNLYSLKIPVPEIVQSPHARWLTRWPYSLQHTALRTSSWELSPPPASTPYLPPVPGPALPTIHSLRGLPPHPRALPSPWSTLCTSPLGAHPASGLKVSLPYLTKPVLRPS